MEENKYVLYSYNENILFRKCSLFNTEKTTFGDCTCFKERSNGVFECKQYGLHFHCAKHPNIEFEKKIDDLGNIYFKCPQCAKSKDNDEHIEIENLESVISRCLKLLNMEKFKDAKLIRLDDYYINEIKAPKEKISNYWIKTYVKTDKDKDTIIVLYVGEKGSEKKAQFFIKPEKLQLTTDHNDIDPKKVISKIEVTLKDRTLKQEYYDEDN